MDQGIALIVRQCYKAEPFAGIKPLQRSLGFEELFRRAAATTAAKTTIRHQTPPGPSSHTLADVNRLARNGKA